MKKISVIGSGAFGTAIANHLTKNTAVKIWSFEPKVVSEINKLHKNLTFLPDADLNPRIEATSDLKAALDFSDTLVNATPVFAVRKTYQDLDLQGKTLVNVSKGIEKGSHKLLHEVFQETTKGKYDYAVLSGPSFAIEVANGLDTFVTLASKNPSKLQEIKEIFETGQFKVETKGDIVGVELGGALKNVLAIASGLASGAGLGKNFQAAIFSLGLEEMSKLGQKMGAQEATFYSMAGLGDLFLTSTSDQSRNFNFGFRLGQGESVKQASEGKTVEGAGSAESAYSLSEKYGLKTVIFKAIYDIIFEQNNPIKRIKTLWNDV